MKRLFAIDLGASGGKCFAAAFGSNGFSVDEVFRFEYEPATFHIPDALGRVTERMYWDDTLIYSNILEGLRTFKREIGGTLDGIGVDAWGADGCFITPDGDMLGKIYAYRDHRLDAMVERVKQRISAERIYAISGIHFQPFNVSNQLLWFLENRNELFSKADKFVPVPSLFHYYLGGSVKIDSTWASVTQLMDIKSKSWSAEILAALGIRPGIMPEIVEPGTVIGRLREELSESLGVERAPLIAVGSHDTASAFGAAPAEDPAEALVISSGTWSLVGRLIPEPLTTPEAMAMNLSNEGGIGNIRLLKNCMGGWLVHELRRGWRNADGKEMKWDEIYKLAEQAPAFVSLIDPDAPVFYNPPDMEKAMRDFCKNSGQPVPAGRGAFLRMVYESLALKYRKTDEDISRVCSRRSSVAHIVGGGAQNELLNQFAADALGFPVLAGPVEATAVGNIMVQALGLGLLASMAEATSAIRQSFSIKRYEPNEHAAWTKAYERFLNLL